MNLLLRLFGVDKVIENQNRKIYLLGQEMDSLRNWVENKHESGEIVGVDPEGGVSWIDRPQAKVELQKAPTLLAGE